MDDVLACEHPTRPGRQASARPASRPGRLALERLGIAHGMVASVLLLCAPVVFAQASAPVTSSVFTHSVTDDSGNQAGAINDNWKFITSPPVHPVAASDPAQDHGSRRGGGGGHRGRGTQASSPDGASSTVTTGAPPGVNGMPLGATGGLPPPATPNPSPVSPAAGSQ